MAPKTWDVLVLKLVFIGFKKSVFWRSHLISYTVLSGCGGVQFSASERSQSLFNVKTGSNKQC